MQLQPPGISTGTLAPAITGPPSTCGFLPFGSRAQTSLHGGRGGVRGCPWKPRGPLRPGLCNSCDTTLPHWVGQEQALTQSRGARRRAPVSEGAAAQYCGHGCQPATPLLAQLAFSLPSRRRGWRLAKKILVKDALTV